MLLGAFALTTGCAQSNQYTSQETAQDQGGSGEGQRCLSPESLVQFDGLGQASLGYEIDNAITSYQADPNFITLLEDWLADWEENSGLGKAKVIWSYGAYVDKCGSWHAAGRAFDIARIEHEKGTVSCRFDEWGPGEEGQLRNYWRLAASLHLHFAYTLTYLYDASHANHIHFDNGVSEGDLSIFDAASTTQTQLVQASCRYLFNKEVEVTGVYDEQTKNQLRQVQSSLGITQPLGTKEGWHAFLRATMKAT